MSNQDYINLVMLPEVVPKVLLLLELNDLVEVKNRQFPDIQSTTTTLDASPEVSIETWIDDWRAQFNSLLNPYDLSMGLGNRQNCINRMKLFMDRVGDDIELIFEATEAYLKDCISKRRKAKMPEYFILPQSQAKLESRDIKTGDLYDWYVKVLTGQNDIDLTNYDL